MEQDRVEHSPEDVVLALVEGAVADPHRTRARVAREVVARGLGQVPAAVDPVHDLERAVVVWLEVGDELHELVRLPVEVEEVKRLQREGRVPHPGEAVVPVALAARRLRQGGGERRHGRPRRHVGQPLDRERRALDRIAVAMVWQPRPPEPPAPEPRRRREPAVRLVDVGRRREVLGPRERAVDLVALLDHMARPHAGRPRCPTAMSVLRRIVCPAPVASAVCRSSPISDHSAGTRP